MRLFAGDRCLERRLMNSEERFAAASRQRACDVGRSRSDLSDANIKAYARELDRLPEPLRGLARAEPYQVMVADALKRLAAEVDRRLAKSGGAP